jgi:hypothetical protein
LVTRTSPNRNGATFELISTDKFERGPVTIRRSPGNQVRVKVDDYFLEFRVGL